MSFSRSRTRRFLLQSLYARAVAGSPALKEAAFFDEIDRIDDTYAMQLESAILINEWKLFSVIYESAPKYDVKTIPLVNVLILFIALTEMLIVRPADVPEKVSIDEAIELAKRYSDDAGKNLINGILNTVIGHTQDIAQTWASRKPLDHSLFHTLW